MRSAAQPHHKLRPGFEKKKDEIRTRSLFGVTCVIPAMMGRGHDAECVQTNNRGINAIMCQAS
jgi:hypothetical protein